jgi:tetratricopeptide (TPR) repeat protein
MARKRRNKVNPVAQPTHAPADPFPDDAGEVEELALDDEGAVADGEFDLEASERTLRACAGIHALARIASTEAANAAGPFLSFAQKSRLAGLATRFDASVMVHNSTSAAAAPAAVAQVVQTEGLTREEIEGIISHRIEIAVHDALANLGLSPDESILHQIERTVETQLASQEHRLMEYLKKQLSDSLEVLEHSLDDRIAEVLKLDGAVEDQQAEVDAQVEEAREALLKNIDEVRTVDVGFDISKLDIAGIAAISDRASSDRIKAVDGSDAVVVADADEDVEIEALADEDEEIEALADEDEEEDGEESPGAAAAGQEVDFAAVAAQEMDDYVEIEAAGEEDDDDLEIEASVADEPAAVLDLLDDDGGVEDISLISPDPEDTGSSPTEEIDLVEAGSDEAAEEELASALEIDLDDGSDDGEDEVGLETLGEGPDDLQLAPVKEAEVDAPGEEDSIEIEDEDDGSTDEEAIARYLQLAQEMRGRRQKGAAMELYSKVVDLDSGNYEARIGRGTLHLEAKDYKRAVEEFTAAEKIDGSRPAAALGRAEVHFQRKQFNKAIRHYTQCLKLDDQLGQAYCNRGLSYYDQKNYKKAFLDLMRAYDLDPSLPNIKKYLKLVRSKVKTDKSVPGSPTPKK